MRRVYVNKLLENAYLLLSTKYMIKNFYIDFLLVLPLILQLEGRKCIFKV